MIPKVIRAIAFPGAPNLPTFAALEMNLFESHGIELELQLTKSSVEQAERVSLGEFEIAFTAFDNVVAYSTGQGAAGKAVDPDYVAIMGASQVELSLVAEPSVTDHSDLRGRSIALDAVNTGFAFVLYEMLQNAGIRNGECDLVAVGATPKRWDSVRSGAHSATLTIEPFTSLAVAQGFKVIDRSTHLFDEYQGGVVASPRHVLEQEPETLSGFIRGYLDGLKWALDPQNQRDAALLLKRRMNLEDRVVEPVVSSVLSPQSGLTPEARVLPNGMQTVLDLRRRHGNHEVPDNPGGFIDLRLWEAATS